MVTAQDLVVWLKDVERDDARFVGVKNANLGEMIKSGFTVPEGFVIPSSAYFKFIKENHLNEKIKHLMGTVNFENLDSVAQVSQHIKRLIKTSHIPIDISSEIFSYYQKLKKINGGLVVVRLNLTSTDVKQNSSSKHTFLNIDGESSVIDMVRSSWASLFESKTILHRHERNVDHLKVGIALLVQRMIQSDTSGVVFSIDPATQNKNRIIIKSIYGLGNYILQGQVIPDHYEISKSDLKIVDKKISIQPIELASRKGESIRISVSERKKGSQKVQDDLIVKLAKLGKEIENYFYFPQEIEWAIEKNKIYLMQVKPITFSGVSKKPTQLPTTQSNSLSKSQVIVIGEMGYPGISVGYAKIVKTKSDLAKINVGDVFVAKSLNNEHLLEVRKCCAIVVEEGKSILAHSTFRKLGIPIVVNAAGATNRLFDKQLVSVNGSTGEVIGGSVVVKTTHNEKNYDLKMATKLFVNITNFENLKEIAPLPVDGVGVLDSEFLFRQIGVHPKKILNDKKEKQFVELLSASIEKVCSAFYPRPIIYKATNFNTIEYAALRGGRHYEPLEESPLLGYRGGVRHISDSKAFSLELMAIRSVREKREYTNLHLMLPFVRTVDELKQLKRIINLNGLKRSSLFKLFIVAQLPSNVILIDKFIEEGIDGVTISLSDLTTLTLGVDRNNDDLINIFNEKNDALFWSYERIIKACNRYKIHSGVYESSSAFPNMIHELVNLGIGSISVNPNEVLQAREMIYKTEQNLIK